MNCERKYSIWFHSYRYKCDFEYFRIFLRDRPFNLKMGWAVWVVMLWFFPKAIFWCWIFKIKLFLHIKCKNKILWWKIFTHKNRFFFLLQGRNDIPLFKLKGRSLTRFHYYIFLPGYGYNGISCGHCQIAVGVHWMEFVSHVKFHQLQTQR